ncbi:hypothetical protein [Chryseobacterium sp. JK1]|uniref:hypothetical protein n=1 Tax=Chryseobacterium sp. JK1 TaxID=874294 RepID=UPI003D69EC36
MKTLELTTNKRLLIVEMTGELETTDLYGWNLQPVKKICKGSELTEEIASKFVLDHEFYDKNMGRSYHGYKDYKENDYVLQSAFESFISAIESKGWYWDKNDLTDSILPPEIDEWKDAQSKTLNPSKCIIFEIL